MDWHVLVEQAAILLMGILGGGAGTAAFKNRQGVKLNLYEVVNNHETRIMKLEVRQEVRDGGV